MPPFAQSSYRYCQSLVKGLDMLAVLNRLPNRSGSIPQETELMTAGFMLLPPVG